MILKKLIDENFKHNLFARIRDMPEDRGNSTATLETKQALITQRFTLLAHKTGPY